MLMIMLKFYEKKTPFVRWKAMLQQNKANIP